MKTTVWIILLSIFAIAFAIPGPVLSAEKSTLKAGIPDEYAPWRDSKNPNVIILQDDKDKLFERRDTSKDPKREAGLVNPQRYNSGFLLAGFPTFLGAPMAFNTEDLMAGNVDVALVGICITDQVIPGGNFGANKMRVLTDWLAYPAGGTNNMIGVDYGKLTIADYGNVGWNPVAQNQRNVEETHRVVEEILAADTIPIGVGGTHVQTYAFHTALAQKYDPGTFVTLHIDAHYDT